MRQLVSRAAVLGSRALPLFVLILCLSCTSEMPTEARDELAARSTRDSASLLKERGRGKPLRLVALLVTPDSAVLEPSASERFTATGRRSDGTLVAVTVTWTASGGSIDSTGMYVAGSGAGTFWVKARLSGGTLEDSSAVRITGVSAPSLQQVEVSPASVELAPGAAAQFSATGRMDDGSTAAITPVWTATGGAVDQEGRYVAGTTAGTYRVIATSGTRADTAAVSILASTPAPAPSPAPPVAGVRGCPESGYVRLVTVSSDAQLAGALANAQPGDQIRIGAGTYSGAQRLDRSGTATSPLVVCGVPGAAPVLKGGQFNASASYLTITGIVFEGAASAEAVNPVYLHGAHHVTFTGNEIRGGHYHAGLSTDEVNHMAITANYIHDNGHDTSHDHGIYFKTTTGDGNVIADNVLVGNAARGISLHDNSGVGVFDVLVTENTIVGNGSTGILVNDGDRITVANNIAAFNGDATGQRQIRVLAGDANRIWNNLTYSGTASRAGIENTTGSAMAANQVADPRFVGMPGDLHLLADSPAIGLARADLATPADFEGRSRDAAPDAGAYER